MRISQSKARRIVSPRFPASRPVWCGTGVSSMTLRISFLYLLYLDGKMFPI